MTQWGIMSEIIFAPIYIHFEITDDPCNLIGSHWCDLFTNRTIFALNRIFLSANKEALLKYNQ